MKYTYLDWNSCGRLSPKVAEAMFTGGYVNPASQHILGQITQKRVRDSTRELINALNGYAKYDCHFVSSATEANIIALKRYDNVFVSDVEHPSVRSCPYAKVIPVDKCGQMRLDILREYICNTPIPFLVSFMLANHETGIINDIKTVCDVVHEFGGCMHVDAVQAFGRIEIDLDKLNIDYMTITSHKFGGPIGIGALIHKNVLGCPTWENRRGTLPVPLIFGMTESLKISGSDNAFLESSLGNIEIVGKYLQRLPNTTCMICPNKTEVLAALSMQGICVSSGAACVSGNSDIAHSVVAMGINSNSLRISSGWENKTEDYLKCVEVIHKFIRY